MKVGYIGLGAMGRILAGHLVDACELSVYDLDEAAIDELVENGARRPESLQEIAAVCDVVFLCLPRSSDVHSLLFGKQGLARSLRPGTVIVDQTSGVPGKSMQMAQELATRNVGMVDAPVSGGIPAAKAGQITIFASGADADWDIVQPILNNQSSKIYRCSGRVGDAQALKLINNAMGAGYRLATLEIAAMGRKLGVSLARMSEVFDAGPAANFTTRHMLPARLEGRATTDFSLALYVKDLNEALALALQSGVAMPITSAVRSAMQIGLNTISMQARLEDFVDLIENLSGSVLTDAPLDPEAGRDLDELTAVLAGVLATCNRLVVYECAALGIKVGLSMATMNTALNAGSAWSHASEHILAELSEQREPAQSATLGDVLAELTMVAQDSAATHSPLFVPNIALAACEAAVAELGPDAESGAALRYVTERGAGVRF